MMASLWTLLLKLGIGCRTTVKKTSYLRVFNTFRFFNKITIKLSYTFPLGKKQSILSTLNTGPILRSKECRQSPTVTYSDKLYYNFFCLPNIISSINIQVLLKTLTSTNA